MSSLRAVPQPIPLAKLAYESLRESILSGHLKAGQTYNEMALAKDLGISRTPVREALLELAAQGLMTFLPRKGVMVNHYTSRDVEEVFEVRQAIELAAVEKVAKAAPQCDLSDIEKTLEDQRKAVEAKNSVAFLKADRIFHLSFSQLTGNRRLVAILENIRDMVQVMGMEALGRAGRFGEVIEEHKKVLDLVRQGRAAEAREAMEHHLDLSKEAVLDQQPHRNR
ncbi:MAG: GntR family transcriptional regulator [Deltaproteobacteria bacterium]|nr:GntR family transcriptional regulator [Deltaproteobacteria bacterium]